MLNKENHEWEWWLQPLRYLLGDLLVLTSWYLELLVESVWLYEFCFRTFWIVFSLYFPFSLFAKHLPLAPTCPGSFPFSVGFTLVATVLCKSS